MKMLLPLIVLGAYIRPSRILLVDGLINHWASEAWLHHVMTPSLLDFDKAER